MIDAVRDMVIVKVHYKETLAGGDIIVPETYGGKENVMEYYGEVVSVGPRCPFELEKGDKIAFERNEGITIKDNQGQEYKALKPRAVLCKSNL